MQWKGITTLAMPQRPTTRNCGLRYIRVKHSTECFQVQWSRHITTKELIPTVLAAAILGPEWVGLTMEAVVAMINLGVPRILT